jgi:hypothetical protein
MPELYDVIVQSPAITANGFEFKFQNVGGTLALLGDVAAVSGSLGGRVGNLEQINEDTNEPTGFVDRTSSVLLFNNSTRTFTISGTYGVYCDGVKFTKTGETQVINNTHGMHFFYYDPNGNFTYSDGTPWSILAPDAMIAAVYWDAQSQLGVLIEERHGCILDAATHYYNHNLYGTQRLTTGAIGGFTIQDSLSNSSVQLNVGPTTLADEDIIYTTVSSMISGSYRFAYRSGASNWVVGSTSIVPFMYDGTNIIKFNSVSGGVYSMQDITTAGTNTFVNYYIVASTSVSGAYSYMIVPGQATYATLSLAQGEAFNNLSLTNFPFIEFNAVYQLTFRYSNSYSGISGRARLEANPVLLGLRSSTQSVAPASTHNALAGLQGGVAGEYFHLTSNQFIDYIGRTEVASISANFNTRISGITGGIGQLDSRYANITGDTFIGNISTPTISITGYASFTPQLSGQVPWAEGRVFYDADDQTLCYYNDNDEVKVNIGQETLIRVVNKTGSDIPNGKVVYINGAQGNRPTIDLADADMDTAHDVVGVTTCAIPDNQTGYVTTDGLVRDVDTNGWVQGTQLWLSQTPGEYIDTPPISAHKVYIARVIRQGLTDGIILVAVDNGKDLSQLHDVSISGANIGDLLVYNGSFWTNNYNITNYATTSSVTSISASLNTRITSLETQTSGITGGISQLDNRFANIDGDIFTGNVTVPSINITGSSFITPDTVVLSGASQDLVVRGVSTGTTYVTLGVKNSGTGVSIPTNSAVSFNVQFTGINTNGSGQVGAFILTGVIRNTAGTTAIQGSPTTTIISRPGVQWEVQAIANDTSDTLEIQAKGPTATTIKWAAKATLVWIGL